MDGRCDAQRLSRRHVARSAQRIEQKDGRKAAWTDVPADCPLCSTQDWPSAHRSWSGVADAGNLIIPHPTTAGTFTHGFFGSKHIQLIFCFLSQFPVLWGEETQSATQKLVCFDPKRTSRVVKFLNRQEENFCLIFSVYFWSRKKNWHLMRSALSRLKNAN